MEWIINNGIVVTPFEIHRDFSVVIENGTIIDLGRASEIKHKYPRYEKIDASRKIILPGLINTHTHAAMTLMRSVADDMELMDWLTKKIWPIEDHLTADDVYHGTLMALVEMIKTGTTAFNDMYFFMDKVAKAVKESGIRGILSRGLIEIPSKEAGEEKLKEGLDFALRYNNYADGRVTTMLGPHAPYTCSPEYLKKIKDIAIEKNLPIHIHLAETKSEKENIEKTYNLKLGEKGVIEYVNELGLLDAKVVAAHTVWLTDKDIKLIAEKQVGVAHNAVSNMKLGSGIAPIPELLTAGALVSIGTDGPASNNTLDMFREMRIVALLHKVNKLNPTVLPATEILKMATVNGAKALGLDKVGEIKVGYKADLILVNLNRASLTPAHNPISLLVYSADGYSVDTMFVDGNLIMEAGEIQTLDEAKIRERGQKQAEDLLERAGVSV
ncbi:MAG: amidohydrolase [Candidatus Odinarchaeota archaeon]|nr:amidohydrolase [Candidatus Odinarchaeota archaeon]